jgi:hypothetical protein
MSIGDINPFYQLSSVTGAPNLSFYTGTPITLKRSANISIMFIVNGFMRKELSTRESNFLITTLKKCMQLLEFTRERGFYDR